MSNITNSSLSPVFEVTAATPGNPPTGDAGFSDLFGQVLASSSSTPETQEPVPPAEIQETPNAPEQEDAEQQETTTEQSSSVEVNTESQASEETEAEESSQDAVEISEDAESVAADADAEVIEVVAEQPAQSSVSELAGATSEENPQQPSPKADAPETHDVPEYAQIKQPSLETQDSVEELPSKVEKSSIQEQVVVHTEAQTDNADNSSRTASTYAGTIKDQLPAKEKATSEDSGDEKAPTQQLVPDAVEETLPDDQSEQHENSGPRRKSIAKIATASPKAQPSSVVADTAVRVEVKTSVETVQPSTESSFQVATPSGPELAASSTARAGSPHLATEVTTSEPELRETPTVERNRFLGRVSGAFKAAQQRDGRIQVRLSPPELGLLRIELSVQQGSLTASLETETNAARNLILENLPVLKERLAEQDIRIETFDVDVRDEGREAPDHELARDRRSQRSGRSVRAGTKASATESTEQDQRDSFATGYVTETDQSLDIRV